MGDVRDGNRGVLAGALGVVREAGGDLDDFRRQMFAFWHEESHRTYDGLLAILVTHTGEAPTLSHREKLRLVELVVEETAGRVPVLAGAGGYDTWRSRFGNTSGRNAVGRRLAAELAAAGLHTVRLDYHGVGDSTGSIDEFVLHEPFVEDLAAAVAALRGCPVDTIGALGDCFGARTALATCAEGAGIEALLLVSLPWRDLARSDRKAHIASSELSVGDYARKGARPSTLLKLRDAGYRRAAARLVSAKGRQLVRRVADRAGDVGVDVKYGLTRSLTAAFTVATFFVIVGLGQMFVITLGPGNVDLSIPACMTLAGTVASRSAPVTWWGV